MGLSDSPLSITSSIAGILTFVAAIAAAAYVRLSYLRNADQEYFQVKTSLSWYKTESQWMHDLIYAGDGPRARSGNDMENQMYIFVMEQLGKLEERLLELLTEAEINASKESESKEWTIVPAFSFTTNIAVSWLRIRNKALELVRQREALGSRLLFAQMSLISSRVRDHESRSRQYEEHHQKKIEELKEMVDSQHEKLGRLEDVVYRLMHTTRVSITNRSAALDHGFCEEGFPRSYQKTPGDNNGIVDHEITMAETNRF